MLKFCVSEKRVDTTHDTILPNFVEVTKEKNKQHLDMCSASMPGAACLVSQSLMMRHSGSAFKEHAIAFSKFRQSASSIDHFHEIRTQKNLKTIQNDTCIETGM